MRTKTPTLNCHASLLSACVKTATGLNEKGYRVCDDHKVSDDVCVLDAFVDYQEQYANTPTLHVLLSRKPVGDFIYEQKGTLYYADNEGVVSFFHYERPGDGYGGRAFELRMKDGSMKTLKGPWSSGEYAINSAGFGPCVSASIAYLDQDGAKVFERGHTYYGSSISIKLALQAIRWCQGVSLMWVVSTLVPVKLGLHSGKILGQQQQYPLNRDNGLSSQQEVIVSV